MTNRRAKIAAATVPVAQNATLNHRRAPIVTRARGGGIPLGEDD